MFNATFPCMRQMLKHKRTAQEIDAEIAEAMNDPEFRAIVKDFIRQNTS